MVRRHEIVAPQKEGPAMASPGPQIVYLDSISQRQRAKPNSQLESSHPNIGNPDRFQPHKGRKGDAEDAPRSPDSERLRHSHTQPSTPSLRPLHTSKQVHNIVARSRKSASVHRFAHTRVSFDANRLIDSLSATETQGRTKSATRHDLKFVGHPQAPRYATSANVLSAIRVFRVLRVYVSLETSWQLQ